MDRNGMKHCLLLLMMSTEASMIMSVLLKMGCLIQMVGWELKMGSTTQDSA